MSIGDHYLTFIAYLVPSYTEDLYQTRCLLTIRRKISKILGTAGISSNFTIKSINQMDKVIINYNFLVLYGPITS